MKSILPWLLMLGIMALHQGRAFGRNAITYEVKARVDVADLLIIRGSEARWYHPGKGAAVGRHNGQDVPTTISSSQDGVSRLDKIAWVPNWPRSRPAEIRYAAFSSAFQNLSPPLPAGDVSVKVSVRAGRGKAAVVQMPHATNDWTLIVRFADGSRGSAFLTARITLETASLPPVEFALVRQPRWPTNMVSNHSQSATLVPALPSDLITVESPSLRVIPSGSNAIQVQWPTNAVSYYLESANGLQSLPDGWTVVTNEPVVLGHDFSVTVEKTEPPRFFRLRKF